MNLKPGDRVGAILSADDKVVRLLGYGVYLGDHIPPDDNLGFLGTVGETKAALEELSQRQNWDAETKAKLWRDLLENPKIQLDNGEVVWGRQCWWGAEAEVKQSIAGRKIELVKMSEILADMKSKS